jgi:hypothetical protein
MEEGRRDKTEERKEMEGNENRSKGHSNFKTSDFGDVLELVELLFKLLAADLRRPGRMNGGSLRT